MKNNWVGKVEIVWKVSLKVSILEGSEKVNVNFENSWKSCIKIEIVVDKLKCQKEGCIFNKNFKLLKNDIPKNVLKIVDELLWTFLNFVRM